MKVKETCQLKRFFVNDVFFLVALLLALFFRNFALSKVVCLGLDKKREKLVSNKEFSPLYNLLHNVTTSHISGKHYILTLERVY